ncbi:MAG: GyrI-like domain-containing protein [Dehalococcoidales bacterium]|nr:GyrI-like domain-containing protein [Dehalococcoidales bacterium]
MQPRIEAVQEKKLVGKCLKMSFSKNRTMELWRSFAPRIKEIKNSADSDLYSVEVYESGFFDNFIPEREFDRWAAIEVTDFNEIPDEMENITLPGGLYAVFIYIGPASAASIIYQAILGTWLPKSEFLLDNRPHFALMGTEYKGEDPGSEEEIWIPIKRKINNK